MQRTMERICPCCGKKFETGSSIKVECSPECRVRRVASDFSGDECWDWPGSLNPKTGYGQLSHWQDGKRKLLTAHRVSFSAFVGPVPDGAQVLHQCDNPACFNPAHLFSGSQRDNMHDMIAKGRAKKASPVGVKHHAAKLTDADVMEIRASKESLAILAERYGLSISATHGAKTGRTWRHIRLAMSSTDSR